MVCSDKSQCHSTIKSHPSNHEDQQQQYQQHIHHHHRHNQHYHQKLPPQQQQQHHQQPPQHHHQQQQLLDQQKRQSQSQQRIKDLQQMDQQSQIESNEQNPQLKQQSSTLQQKQYKTEYGSKTQKRQPKSQIRDSIETIPSSNVVDSTMYERDKQIYKCSTMKAGGKFDMKNFPGKPSILNCPLPEIPKQENDSQNRDVQDSKKISDECISITRTLQRYPKHVPTGKAIPPPKIIEFTTNSVSATTQKATDTTPTTTSTDNTNKSTLSVINTQQPPPINPNDESNYAVTEL